MFDALAVLGPGYGGEIQLTDAVDALGRRGRCRAYVTGTEFLDIGHPQGFLYANFALASSSPDYGEDSRSIMKKLLEE